MKPKGTKGKYRQRSNLVNSEEDLDSNASPKKASRSISKRVANQKQLCNETDKIRHEEDQNEAMIEIIDSEEENEVVTYGMQVKPTLYHLNQEDLESVEKKNNLMRGKCVQAIMELLHAEKGREELTCVSTDFYSLLMENKTKEAKFLLHQDEGCKSGNNGNWKTPDTRIATAHSRILIIPCHDTNHWFLTIRIKLEGGNHQVLIIDSLGKESGRKHMPKIRGRLK